jgi:hypothetical protein
LPQAPHALAVQWGHFSSRHTTLLLEKSYETPQKLLRVTFSVLNMFKRSIPIEVIYIKKQEQKLTLHHNNY